MKNPSIPPAIWPGSVRSQPRASGTTADGRSALAIGATADLRVRRQQPSDLHLPLLGLQAAPAVDQPSARGEPALARASSRACRSSSGARSRAAFRCSTSGWRRAVPVAEQGESSRIASKRPSGSQVERVGDYQLGASPCAPDFAPPARGGARRCRARSRARPSAASWSVLPPGAAHRSSTRSPGAAASRRAGRLAARSCTHHAPSSKPGELGYSPARKARTWPGNSEVPPRRSAQSAVSLASRSVRSSGGSLPSAARSRRRAPAP